MSSRPQCARCHSCVPKTIVYRCTLMPLVTMVSLLFCPLCVWRDPTICDFSWKSKLSPRTTFVRDSRSRTTPNLRPTPAIPQPLCSYSRPVKVQPLLVKTAHTHGESLLRLTHTQFSIRVFSLYLVPLSVNSVGNFTDS